LGLGGSAAIAWGQEGAPEVKPTAEHERLGKEAGTWDATIKTWMPGKDSDPAVSKGVEVGKVMPGGLWLLTDFEGKLADQSFHGRGQTGYDPRKKKYVGTWVDSMSPAVLLLEGEYDPETRVTTMYAKGSEPDSGQPYEMKTTSKFEGDDSRVFTMYVRSENTKGEYLKVMEIAYKRRSK
jgi:hypothetical protein